MKINKELKKQKNPAKKSSSKIPVSNHGQQLILFVIVLISFIVYLPVLQNGFVNWDETIYIQDNLMIRSIDIEKIFSTFQLGNYHPITMLAYSIEYHFWGLKETGYHAVNLVIHLLNIVLVYKLILLLCEKKETAFIAALLFGIHPIHVESVAWAAELKDLLYTFFFLGACIWYIKFARKNQIKYYLFAVLLFILSLLSKAMAVSLPFVLVLIDYLLGRKINKKALIEKIPFLLLSLVFGVVAIMAQKSTDSLQNIAIYSFPQRLVFACSNFITYLVQLVIPFNLCAFYPYPIKSGSALPLQYYLFVFAFFGIIAYAVYSMRFSKKIFFSIAFFTVTVFLVLQLLPVGDAVMADRYNYIPSIGIFYLAGEGYFWLSSKKNKIPAILLLISITVIFSVQTYARCGVWKNSMTLWNDVINKYPNVSFAYNNRGGTLMNENKNEEALKDYNKAIELRPDYSDALNNRGILFMNALKYEDALRDFNKALQASPNLSETYNNRGLVLMYLKNYNESLRDFNKAIELKPNYAQAFYNRGLLEVKENKFDQALEDYNKAIALISNYTNAYISRGVLFHNQKKYENALIDYNKALEFEPKNPQIYYNKGLVLMAEKKFDDAISIFSTAIDLKNDFVVAYYVRGMSEYFSGNKDSACQDFMLAIKMGHQPAKDAYTEYCK